MPWADLLYACDYKWWSRYYREARENFAGTLWTASTRTVFEFKEINHVRGAARMRPARGYRHQVFGATSGHHAYCLAVLFGAARITLVAYDMMAGPHGEVHHHGNHPSGLENGGDFRRWRKSFDEVISHFKHPDTVNASRETALTCMPRRALEERLL